MAKFDDYVEQTDELQEEITTAAEEAENRESELPERFKGKSAQEIADSYIELEKMNSRQSQDLGEMRRTVDELVRQSDPQNQEGDASADEPITVDDLYEDAEAAIAKVIEKRTPQAPEHVVDPTTTPEYAEAVKELDSDFEGWNDLVKTPEFKNWVFESPYRARAAQAADGYDFDAARELLSLYHATHQVGATAEEKAAKEKALNDATLESGGAEYEEPVEAFSRSELLNLRIRAKRGDFEAENYLKAHREHIAIAYEEGRIVD